ncbi:MAG: right-handed parallel beta-helix repeat-containing protein [Acidobacteria bacterium]|nr:right-handed parallel beta-helix repeat-containing protein [Acidobacteriota bacterium]
MPRIASTQTLAALVCLLFARSATAATFAVNSTGDSSDVSKGNGVCATSSGTCTLRAAIQEANASAEADTIVFALSTGYQRIAVSSPLPTITRPLVIDGATQAGFAGKPLIEIWGKGTVNGAGLAISSGPTTVRRLVVNGFDGPGIYLNGATGVTLERNYVGTNVDGTAAVWNRESGIRLRRADNNVVQYNLISGNAKDSQAYPSGSYTSLGGLEMLDSSDGNLVQGNIIGLDVTGLLRVGNYGRGVAVHASNQNVFRGNVISANYGSGFRIYGEGTGNLVEGNYVGLAMDATLRGVGNFAGVQIRSSGNTARNNVIAGNEDNGVLIFGSGSGEYNITGTASNNLIQSNTIAYNGQNGVGIFDGDGNTVTGNAIWGNRLWGIDVSEYVRFDRTGVAGDTRGNNRAGDDLNVNDVDDLDGGTNDRQNYPVIRWSMFETAGTRLALSLNSEPSSQMAIEFFATPECDDTGYGEAEYPLGSITVPTDAGGDVHFEVVIPNDLRGYYVTTTATNPRGDTSEMSACQVVVP